MDPFETDEEEKERVRRNATLVIGLIILVVVGGSMLFLWERLKPLPQNSACAAIGWSAGTMEAGVVTCYDNCVDNNVHHCKKIWVKP